MNIEFDKNRYLWLNTRQIKGVWFMKKYLTVLLCTFIFFFSDVSAVNTDITNEKTDNEVLVRYKLETGNVEQETLENEPENTDNSITEEYVEEVNTTNETYNESYTYTVNYGTYGRLYVSWYDVALYDYNVYTDSSLSLQELVDNYDSAAYYTSYGRLVIADHDYQGFSVLTSLSEGATAYIKFGDGSTIGYRLIQKSKGYNTGPDLIDTEENSFFEMDSDLIMYTCYDGGIMVTLWRIL